MTKQQWRNFAVALSPSIGFAVMMAFVVKYPLAVVPAIAITCLAAVSIRLIVRWVNLRDDPQFARHPPDAP